MVITKYLNPSLNEKIQEIEKRNEFNEKVRLAYIGVPPIIFDLYDFVETLNARAVYNEVQRQFTMADSIGLMILLKLIGISLILMTFMQGLKI